MTKAKETRRNEHKKLKGKVKGKVVLKGSLYNKRSCHTHESLDILLKNIKIRRCKSANVTFGNPYLMTWRRQDNALRKAGVIKP